MKLVGSSHAYRFVTICNEVRERKEKKCKSSPGKEKTLTKGSSNHITTSMERYLQLLISLDAAHLSAAQELGERNEAMGRRMLSCYICFRVELGHTINIRLRQSVQYNIGWRGQLRFYSHDNNWFVIGCTLSTT
jgi:hypothetical protein